MTLQKTLRTSRIAAAIGVAGASIASSGEARTFLGDSFEITKQTIDGGGGTSTGSTFELSGTIGQHDATSVALSGGDFELVGGFWPGATPVPVDPCPADVAPLPNGDGLVNVNDLLAVISGWGPCPAPCPPHCGADVTDDCTVNVNDLLAVISAWGLCPQ